MSDAARSLAEARKAWRWMVVLGVALVIAGIAAIARPLAAGVTVTMFIGWLMIFAGVSQIFGAFVARGFGALLWRLVLAFVYTGAGAWIISQADQGLAVLTLILGIALIADGCTTFVYAFALPHFLGKGMLFISAIFSILFGIIIWSKWPASSELVIGSLLGIRFLFAGWSFVMLGMAVKNAPES